MAKVLAAVIAYEDRQQPAVAVVIDAASYKPLSHDQVRELLERNNMATVIRKVRLAGKRRSMLKIA